MYFVWKPRNSKVVFCLWQSQHCEIQILGTILRLTKRTLWRFFDIYIKYSTKYQDKGGTKSLFAADGVTSGRNLMLQSTRHHLLISLLSIRHRFCVACTSLCYLLSSWMILFSGLEKNIRVHESRELSYPSCWRYQREVDQTIWKWSQFFFSQQQSKWEAEYIIPSGQSLPSEVITAAYHGGGISGQLEHDFITRWQRSRGREIGNGPARHSEKDGDPINTDLFNFLALALRIMTV